MSKDIKIHIDIGDNLLKAILKVADTVDRENSRCDLTLCPGVAVKRAFGINLMEMHKNELVELRKRRAL